MLKIIQDIVYEAKNEGVRISCCDADICMNLKTEVHQPSIVRVSASLGSTNEEETGLNPQSGGRGARRWGPGAGQPGAGEAWGLGAGAEECQSDITLFI